MIEKSHLIQRVIESLKDLGVTEGQKSVSQPLERKRTLPFHKLIDQIAQGRRDDDASQGRRGGRASSQWTVSAQNGPRPDRVRAYVGMGS